MRNFSEVMVEDVTRRGFLGIAAAGGVVAGQSLLPPSVHAAMARPMPRGGLKGIEHVVVLMQENRAFDHYFGSLRGVRGFGDPDPHELPGGAAVFEQPDGAGGRVLPFSLREAAERAGRPDSDIQYLDALAHNFPDATAAWDRGWWNGWVPAKTASTMTYYQRRDLAMQYELADTFTICDAYHCSIFGSTNPNRNYLWTGKVGVEPGTDERAVTNAAYDYDHPGYTWTTYPERLEDAGVPWQIYQEWDNFTDNPVEYFLRFKRIGHQVLASVEGTWRTTEELYTAMLEMSPADRDQALAGLRTGRATLSGADRRLFDRAMSRSAPGTLMKRIRADIDADRLPAVTWVVPPAADSEHPSVGTPLGSANLVYQLLDAIASRPGMWEKTVLLVNFDENDGYFDHVPPPVQPRPADGNSPDWYDGLPIGLGPRVPMTVVSPWTIGGYVASEVFDHTSVLRFLEGWTGVREPNISAWRREVCGDLSSAFDFERKGHQPDVEHPGAVPPPVDRWHPDPPTKQRLPGQERGRRRSRPVPYEPSVAVGLEGRRLRLELGNAGERSAHFTLYPYSGELSEPRHVDVRGSQREVLEVPGRSYRVRVQGPDRFWCEAAGHVDSAGSGLLVATRAHGHVLRVLLENTGEGPLTVRVRSLRHGSTDERVRLRPGDQRTVPVEAKHGWYDVQVGVAQDRSFHRRVTGRVGGRRRGLTP